MHSSFLKLMFYLEQLAGIRVETIENLEKNELTLIYPLFLLALDIVYICYLIVRCLYSNGYNNYNCSPIILHKAVRGIFVAFSLYTAIQNRNNKMSTAMKLEAVEKQMVRLNFNIPEPKWERVITYFSALLYVIQLVESFTQVVYLFIYTVGFSLFDVIVCIHHDAVKVAVFFSCIFNLTRTYKIHHGILNELQRLRDKTTEDSFSVAVIPIRQAWVEVSETTEDILLFLRRAKNLLSDCEQELQSTYWPYVTWLAVVSAVSSPAFGLIMVRENVSTQWATRFTMMSYVLLLITIVCVQSKLLYIKQSCHRKMCDLITSESNNSERVNERGQICGSLHTLGPWDCYFFYLHYSLLLTTFETILLVFCAMFSHNLN